MNNKIQKRQTKEKELLIEELKKTPIIEFVCKKNNIARATFYRWEHEDLEFAKKADGAIAEGLSKVSDLAESKLIASIQEGNLTAIIFWLKSHNPQYRNESKTEINIGDNRKIIVRWADGQIINQDYSNREELK